MIIDHILLLSRSPYTGWSWQLIKDLSDSLLNLRRGKNELIHSQSDNFSPLLLHLLIFSWSAHLSTCWLRLEHKTEVGGNLNDLCDLERRCLELLGVAEFAVWVEDLRSKDIVVLPEEQELEEKVFSLKSKNICRKSTDVSVRSGDNWIGFEESVVSWGQCPNWQHRFSWQGWRVSMVERKYHLKFI